MTLEGDRARTIFAMAIARATKDDAYRKRLIMNPREVLKEEGLDFPADVNVRVLENTSSVKYVGLSRDFAVDAADVTAVGDALRKVFPIPEGHEVRLVQSTDKTRYLVIPYYEIADPGKLSDAELMAMAGGSWSVEATYKATTEAVAAESTEVTVTQTSVLQDAEAVSTAAVAGEIVAVGAAVFT